MEKVTNDTILISVDFNHGEDNGVLIVGRKRPNKPLDIINAFRGEEAKELYQKLITKKVDEK